MTKILTDFKICISVTLIFKFESTFLSINAGAWEFSWKFYEISKVSVFLSKFNPCYVT